MSFPWIHESEMKAARAEAEADIPLTDEDRAFQRRLNAAYRAWLEQQAEAEAEPEVD